MRTWYKRIVVRSDQEPAFRVLKAAVKRESPYAIVGEESPVGESQSLGGINVQIPCIQGRVRTLRDALESRYSERLTEGSPIIPWMIMHAAGILNKFRVGSDGHTAYQRVKGRAFVKELA